MSRTGVALLLGLLSFTACGSGGGGGDERDPDLGADVTAEARQSVCRPLEAYPVSLEPEPGCLGPLQSIDACGQELFPEGPSLGVNVVCLCAPDGAVHIVPALGSSEEVIGAGWTQGSTPNVDSTLSGSCATDCDRALALTGEPADGGPACP